MLAHEHFFLRHHATTPAPANKMPGRPAPTMGPGTAKYDAPVSTNPNSALNTLTYEFRTTGTPTESESSRLFIRCFPQTPACLSVATTLYSPPERQWGVQLATLEPGAVGPMFAPPPPASPFPLRSRALVYPACCSQVPVFSGGGAGSGRRPLSCFVIWRPRL